MNTKEAIEKIEGVSIKPGDIIILRTKEPLPDMVVENDIQPLREWIEGYGGQLLLMIGNNASIEKIPETSELKKITDTLSGIEDDLSYIKDYLVKGY